MSDPVALRYRAFISYSHADASWAKWLHGWLESFRGDKDLMGRDAAGNIQTTLRPIFRHGDDQAGGHALARAALDASRALIVICSPACANSQYVTEQIRLFRSRHPKRPVIPLIVSGQPGDPELECFPPSLKFKLDADGKITDKQTEVFAADARAEIDSQGLALADVVGRLLGVSADEVLNRSERGFRHAKRQLRLRALMARIKVGTKGSIAAAVLALIVLASALTYFNYQRRQALAAIEALGTNYGAIDSARGSTPEAGPSVTEAIASIANGATREPGYATALELLQGGQYQKSEALLKAIADEKLAAGENKEAAEVFRALGPIVAISDNDKAGGYYTEAASLDADHVEGMFWHGWFQAKAGSLNEAEAAYRKVVSTAQEGKEDWAVFWAHLGIGDIRISRGDLSAAFAEYQAASEMADRLDKADPHNSGWASDVRVAYIRVGDVLAAQGDLAEALKSYRKGLSVTEPLDQADRGNAGWMRDLVAIYGRAGSVLAQQGNTTLARDTFDKARANAVRLRAQFADDAQLTRQLAALDAEIAKLEQPQLAKPAIVRSEQTHR